MGNHLHQGGSNTVGDLLVKVSSACWTLGHATTARSADDVTCFALGDGNISRNGQTNRTLDYGEKLLLIKQPRISHYVGLEIKVKLKYCGKNLRGCYTILKLINIKVQFV